MKEIARQLIMYIGICVIVLVGSVEVNAKTVLDSNTTEKYLNTISNNLMSTYANPTFGSTGGEWMIIGLARDGSLDRAYADIYKKNLSAVIKKCNGELSENKYTEYSRVILAITALGEDATSFGGYNLVEKICDVDSVRKQGINGMAYALIALDCGKYNDDASEVAREKYISEILQTQLADGGWNIAGKSSEVDVTALCIQSLTPYLNSSEEVKKAVQSGINLLSKLQCNSGGFATMGVENCESVAQVLVAISGMGISVEDERFVKGDNTLIDALLDYYKDGNFSHIVGKSKNAMATDQGMCALVSYYRNVNNKKSLYDMSDGLVHRVLGETIIESNKSEKSTSREQNETTVASVNNKSGNDNKNTINNVVDKSGKSSVDSSIKDSDINKKTKKTTKKSNKNSKEKRSSDNKKDSNRDSNKAVASVEEVSPNIDKKSAEKKLDTEKSMGESTVDSTVENDTSENEISEKNIVGEMESVIAEDNVSEVRGEAQSEQKEYDITKGEEINETQAVEYDKRSDYIKIIICIIVIVVALGCDKLLFLVKKKQGKDNNVKRTKNK